MKKIYITLFVLLIAMVAMVYLYFSELTTKYTTNDASLHAATATSGMIFCLRNDQDIISILSGQDDFRRLIGNQKSKDLNLLKNELLSKPEISRALAGSIIYLSFMPGANKDYDYLISTQLNNKEGQPALLNTLKNNRIKTESDNGMLKIILKDSSIFYLGIHNKLLLLSNHRQAITAATNAAAQEKGKDFANYIKTGDKFNKNSVANLYLDFNRFPALLKIISPNSTEGELSIFNRQNAFAAMSYNFSKERVFFNGSCKTNDESNYFSLFKGLQPQKNSLDNILPDNTANFTLFAIPEYTTWNKALKKWFILNGKNKMVAHTIANINQKYRLNLDQIFPKYFRNQLISFQLKTSEKLGAIQLSNGDKVNQLLLDLSTDYNADIKLLKEADLLYCYFGEPFKKFRRPYYAIIDNYMVFSNYPGILQAFLNHYKNNQLLITTADYSSLYNQISDQANITFYVNHENSSNLIRNTFYTPYFRYASAAAGFGKFNTLVYQLSGDKNGFQSNLLINTTPENTNDMKQALTDTSEINQQQPIAK